MTYELILTSVARGLDPNDSGFCPVAADSEISQRIVDHLVALSNYRYLVSESGDLSCRSPIAYSHLILPGGLEHALSRVAGAGTDYRGQPNALAHHVVLESMDCPAENPAWVLALPGFHFSEWNSPPIRFAQGRPIPTLTSPPSLTRRQQIARQHRWLDPQKTAPVDSIDIESTDYLSSVQNNDEQIILAVPPTSPCPTWEKLTGDSGWGGVLAETVFTGQPVVLIYPPERNILSLYVEALALLPEYSAWKTTFSTYYTGLPEEIPCQWKGVLAGSEEVKRLVRDLNNLVIDLTVPMGEAQSGRYVNFARSGQEHMLPLDIEEYAAAIAAANEETKSHDETTQPKTDKFSVLPSPPQTDVPLQLPTKIQLPPKQDGLLETLLRRSSRFQFYFLYSIMFVLVLFLLFLAIDQVGNFGLVQKLQNWNLSTTSGQLDETEPEPKAGEEAVPDSQIESDIAQIEQEIFAEIENTPKNFEEDREKQREPLLLFWENFAVPEFLAINFPTVEDNQIDIPARTTFSELSPLHPFGTALDLHFIPLFELPLMHVETSLVVEKLPELVWQTHAVDTETELPTPMFQFQLTETGIDMDWQPAGLNNQHLYETILSSLGFLQLNVVDAPDSAKQIPLFVPFETVPMKVSELANLNLAGWETPEHEIELPFASELWQGIFATKNPPYTLRLEVRVDPEGDWVKTAIPSESGFQAEIKTTQQARRKTTEGGDTFDHISIVFAAEVSLERIVWKGDEYAERLRFEQEEITMEKPVLEENIGRLQTQVFDGNQNAKPECDELQAKLRNGDIRLGEIDSILEKLPSAYKELSANESGRFHYSVFLESPPRQLLLLRTMP